jgi:hypothetical protein
MNRVFHLIAIVGLFTAVSARAVLPSGWNDADIGSPGQPGTAFFSDGAWIVNGGGADIWSTSDQFHFASMSIATNAAGAFMLGPTNDSMFFRILLQQ